MLTYHVVPGKVMAADVKPGQVTTVEGSPATITVDGSTVKINGANVVQTDVAASNGVIHVIDTVLHPPGRQPLTKAAGGASFAPPRGTPGLLACQTGVVADCDLCEAARITPGSTRTTSAGSPSARSAPSPMVVWRDHDTNRRPR